MEESEKVKDFFDFSGKYPGDECPNKRMSLREGREADVAIRLPLPSPTGKVPAVAGG